MSSVALNLVSMLDGDAKAQVYSQLHGPIESLSFLRRSLLFAELSNIAYLSRCEAGLLANRIGFPEIRFYDREGAQSYIFANEHDAVVTCRGTQPDDWNDIKADLDLQRAVAETAGWVHRGFKKQVDDLWPRLEQALVNNSRPLWFTGHSLGAAMAAICAGRCKLSYIKSNPRALFTYGSPRVGNNRYVNFIQLEAYRWVNNNDIVTRVPPMWLGYRHKGQEIYLNAYGKIRRLTPWQRFKDRWRGTLRGLRERRFDPFADHSIVDYVRHIREAVEEAEGIRLRPVRSAPQFTGRPAVVRATAVRRAA
jgi:triacylglycerol lipase